MLSVETEARITKLLLNLADGEKAIQTTRQILSNERQFDPYLAFKRFDKENKNSIDEFNIVEFLK
jgi:hypothetical protein